jgi:hypothetical protein
MLDPGALERRFLAAQPVLAKPGAAMAAQGRAVLRDAGVPLLSSPALANR